MIGRRFVSTRNRRRGFTLVEVMLTLCLLVIITSLAWPLLQKPWASQRLRKAADEIRAQWAGARVEAMDSGRTYIFRYDVGGERNRFRVESYATAETQEDPVFDNYFDASAGGLGYLGAPSKPVSGTLPEGVTFVASQTELDTRAATFEPAMDESDASEADWSEPIFFYPDGTTSSAVLQLKNQYNRCLELSLRGLTGTVTVGELFTGGEQSP